VTAAFLCQQSAQAGEQAQTYMRDTLFFGKAGSILAQKCNSESSFCWTFAKKN
jgi:hypothetical protein